MEVNALGAHVVRDVFVAADEMHENAMSEMDGNTLMDGDSSGNGVGATVREGRRSPCTEPSDPVVDHMEVEREGESPSGPVVFQ